MRARSILTTASILSALALASPALASYQGTQGGCCGTSGAGDVGDPNDAAPSRSGWGGITVRDPDPKRPGGPHFHNVDPRNLGGPFSGRGGRGGGVGGLNDDGNAPGEGPGGSGAGH